MLISFEKLGGNAISLPYKHIYYFLTAQSTYTCHGYQVYGDSATHTLYTYCLLCSYVITSEKTNHM